MPQHLELDKAQSRNLELKSGLPGGRQEAGTAATHCRLLDAHRSMLELGEKLELNSRCSVLSFGVPSGYWAKPTF